MNITEKDIDIMMEGYSSKEIFGPELWGTLEKFIIGYDPNCKRQMVALANIINSLPLVIPCEECAEHFETQLSKNPPPYESRLKMLQWIIELHDNVNERNGKERLGFEGGLENISNRISNNMSKSIENTVPTVD